MQEREKEEKKKQRFIAMNMTPPHQLCVENQVRKKNCPLGIGFDVHSGQKKNYNTYDSTLGKDLDTLY